jgi:ABC-type sugar transport system substrate-binding protein
VMETKRRRRIAARAAVLAAFGAAVAVAGCGSSDDSKSTSSASTGAAAATTADSGGDTSTMASDSGDSAGVTEAKKFVADNLQNPTEVRNGDKPLSKTPPTGKTIAYLQCGTPNCKDIGDAVEEAAGALGWNVKRIDAGLTPEEVVKAWNTAISLKPDAAMIAGFGRDVAGAQIKQFAATGAPWVAESLTDPVGEDGLLAVIDGPQDFIDAGKWLANWMVAESGGDVNAILFNSPAFVILKQYQTAMQDELMRLCPDCKFQVQNINPADAGTKLPQTIVSAAQRNPDVNYVVPAWSDGAIGVPQALKSGNLTDRVKMITQGEGKVNLQQVQNGETPAFVPRSATLEGWMMVDALARHFVGDPVDEDAYATVPRQYLTPDNLEAALGGSYGSYKYDGVLDYADQYKKLWKVGG